MNGDELRISIAFNRNKRLKNWDEKLHQALVAPRYFQQPNPYPIQCKIPEDGSNQAH